MFITHVSSMRFLPTRGFHQDMEVIHMSLIDWRIRGLSISTCNCDWGCPCQFSALPTRGQCSAGVAIRIDEGHFGGVRLDGLCFGGIFAWPGAIHEGRGKALPLVDQRAESAQRDAILTIMSGGETEPGATIFNVFAATFETVHPPLFRDFAFDCDLEGRIAAFRIDGIVDARVEPIRNPVSKEPQRVRVVMPGGFEFAEAEFASGQLDSGASTIPLQWRDRHAHLNRVDMNGRGLIRAVA
jgi:hypothetical protein